MKKLFEEARKLIRMNSVTANGDEEIAGAVETLMQERGFKTQLQQVTHSFEEVSKFQYNVIGILGDPLIDRKIRKGLLLCTHLDTVGPGLPEHWTETGGDPFSATLKDGKIFGLGTSDAKLDFLCKLAAVEKFRERKFKMPLYLVGTCGEELGMFGTKYLIKSLALNPKYVVVGQPTELKIVYAHKSLCFFRVNVAYQQVERDARGYNRRIDFHAYGKSAHGSYPYLGVNAIHSAFEFLRRSMDAGFDMRFTRVDGGDALNKVPDRASIQFYVTSHQFEDFKRFFREVMREENKERAYRVELGGVGDAGVRFLPDPLLPCTQDIAVFFRSIAADFEKVKDESYSPPYSTVCFGKLRQTPGQVILGFDMRVLPDLVIEDIERHIQQGIAAIAGKYPSLNVTAVRERLNPGLGMDQSQELATICAETLKSVGMEAELVKRSISTEAALYFHAGYQAIAFGPGVSQGSSHSPNEYNVMAQMEKAIEFYERLIERVCL